MKAVPANPFRPGAGQKPLYLAGRTRERDEYQAMLNQNPVLQNVIITGLRGVGKTVLLEELKPFVISAGWLSAGNDLSETASLTEERICTRIIVDLAAILAPFITFDEVNRVGFVEASKTIRNLTFDDLWNIYTNTPGLASDKLKAVLLATANTLENSGLRGVVFAYDEAQNLADHAIKGEYPLSLLLDVFSYIQRQPRKFQFLLTLAGLPTLLPKLNEARTYTERMFHVLELGALDEDSARQAIRKPIEIQKSSLTFSEKTVSSITKVSAGYPFFIQYVCKEVFDVWISKIKQGEVPSAPMDEIIKKLDQDFFSGRWQRATDRQQDFLHVIATLENSDGEFSVQDIVIASKQYLKKGFSPSHATQMLQALADKGLVYKNSRGRYRLAVPLMSRFIQRQHWPDFMKQDPPS